MERADLYTRITDRIIAELESGTRPWLQPWNAEHAAGRITRPLRHNGLAYRGINVITLWLTAARVRLPDLADLQAGPGARGPGAQGRTGGAGGVRQPDHPHPDQRDGRGN